MLPDRVSNPGPLTYESGALPIALRGPALQPVCLWHMWTFERYETVEMIMLMIFVIPSVRHILYARNDDRPLTLEYKAKSLDLQ